MEMLCLLKTSRDSQMLFADVTHLVEGLRLETLLTLKVEKYLMLSEYAKTSSIHNRITILFLKILIRNKGQYCNHDKNYNYIHDKIFRYFFKRRLQYFTRFSLWHRKI
jgi:hypothetical protein